MTSIIHPSKWQISHPVRTDGGSAFDVPKCLWDDRCDTACGVATARDTAGGGDEGMSLLGIHAWKFVKHDIQMQLQMHMYIMCLYYIYIDIIYVYMYMYIQFALVVKRYLNGAVWHFKAFQRGVSAKWHWKSVKRPMWMVAMRNTFSGCLWSAPPRP